MRCPLVGDMRSLMCWCKSEFRVVQQATFDARVRLRARGLATTRSSSTPRLLPRWPSLRGVGLTFVDNACVIAPVQSQNVQRCQENPSSGLRRCRHCSSTLASYTGRGLPTRDNQRLWTRSCTTRGPHQGTRTRQKSWYRPGYTQNFSFHSDLVRGCLPVCNYIRRVPWHHIRPFNL